MNIEELKNNTEHIEYTFEITEQLVQGFRSLSGDENPLHIDDAYAQSFGFAQRVVYGNILNLYVSRFVGMLLPEQKVILQSQDISYCRPIYSGDKIRLTTTVDSYSEAVKTIVYKLKFSKIESHPTGLDKNHNSQKESIVARGHVQIGLLE